MISTLFKQHTGYKFVNLGQTTIYWVKTQIDKLVKKEMRLETKIEKDDFKIAIEQFAKRMQIVSKEIEDLVKI